MAGPAPPPGFENQDNGASARTSLELRFERESGYLIVKKLGQGGCIRRGTNDEARMAILNDVPRKLLAAKLSEHREETEKEISLLKYTKERFGQPGIVQLTDPDADPNQDWFTMEALPAGTLHDFQKFFYENPDLRIPVSLLWHVTYQLAETLQFLFFGIANGKRSKGWLSIVHNDLHLQNLMFRFPGAIKCEGKGRLYPDLTLVDFGCADWSDNNPRSDGGMLDRLAHHMPKDTRNVFNDLHDFISKTQGDQDQLEAVFERMERLQKSDGNKDVAKALADIIQLAKKKRDALYDGLPPNIMHYLARPAATNDELQAFLGKLRT